MTYRGLITTKIKPALGATRLHRITPRVLDAFYDQLRERGNAKAAIRARQRARAATAASGEDLTVDLTVAAATPTASDRRLSAARVRDVHVILAGALRLAARWGLIPFNPNAGQFAGLGWIMTTASATGRLGWAQG